MSKKILLTGVGGFIGVHFLKYYLKNTDWQIIGLDSFRHKGTYSRLNEIEIPKERFTLLRHDLSVPIDKQLENLIMSRRINERGAIVDQKLDAIINLASDSAVERSVGDPGWCWRNNCELIFNILELARKIKPKVFYQISSDEVYGDCPIDSEGHNEWDVISPSNPYCLLPDTRIFTQNGWSKIKDLDILKEKIVSKTSASCISFQNIYKKFKYNYSGNIRLIKTVVGEISATDEHKFFRMETHFSKGNNLLNANNEPIEVRPHRKIVEQPSKNLKKGDKILCVRYMPFPKETVKKDISLSRFLGYFLGDGSYSKKTKYIRLADQKLNYINFYKNLLENFIGISKKSSTKNFGNVYKHSSKDCWYLQFASQELREMVDLSDKNKIIESTLFFEKQSLLYFLAGFFDAESHFRIEKDKLKSIVVFQKEKYTLEVVQLLLHRIGVVSSIREVKKGFILLIRDSYSMQIFCKNVPTLKKEIDNLSFPKMQHKNWNKKFYWCRIIDIKDQFYNGDVYDLEIIKHRNFVAEFFVVHNSASKAAQEALAISYWRSYGVPVVLSNCMNCIATMQDKEKFLPKIIWKIATNQPMDIYVNYDDNGNKVIGSRRYLHCENHADVFKFLMDKPIAEYSKGDSRPDRYNVVGEIELNNLEMAESVAKIMGKKLKPNFIAAESARPGYDKRYALRPGKLESMGWRRPIEFFEGLENIIKWTLDHPWWII